MFWLTDSEFKKYVAVSGKFSVDQGVETQFVRAANKFVIKYLGSEEFYALKTAYTANSMTAAQTALLEPVRRIIANFSVNMYGPFLQVKISDSGIHRVEADNEATAYRYQIADLKKELIASGYEAIEEMLELLESDEASYPSWFASSNRTAFKQSFIKYVDDFQQYIDISSSRRMLMALLPHIQREELFTIRQTIQRSVFDAMKAAMLGNSLTTEQEALRQKCVPVLAHLAYKSGLKSNLFKFNEEGLVQLISDEDQGYSDSKDVLATKINTLIEFHESAANQYLSELKDYLSENAGELGFTVPTPIELNKEDSKTAWL